MSKPYSFVAAATLFVSISTGGTAVAQAADPTAKAALNVLDKHCARCHQAERMPAGKRPSGGIGNILALEQIAANPTLIQPGNPQASLVLKVMLDGKMPYDVYQSFEGDHPTPTQEEMDALAKWIGTLAADPWSPCGSRPFIGNYEVVAAIADDLGRLSDARARGTRYLTLASIANTCADEVALKVYRQGAVKLLNSLARTSTVVRLEPFGPADTILRFNIDDLGWTAADWETVLAAYPYRAIDQRNRGMTVLESATKTKLPYVRADWFAFAASQAPLYDKLLQMPATFAELVKKEGVDIDGNIALNVAKRAGFQKSGVSQHNRLIERHPSRSGYFWTSYDFASSSGAQSLFNRPLGPKGNDPFKHDGGESIWSLPNGFQAYYLNAADGKQLQKGPTTIVRDERRPDFAVLNALSCFGCHDAGMKEATDEIRRFVLESGKTFERGVKEAVAELYPDKATMDALLREDRQRFFAAMARAGLDPALKLNGDEPITALVKLFEGAVSPRVAAAELGLRADRLHKSIGDAGPRTKKLVKRLETGNSVPREEYEALFAALVADLTDETILQVAVADAVQPPKPGAGKIEFDLALTADKTEYKVGDLASFEVVSAKDCFLTLLNEDKAGVKTVLLPNPDYPENRIKAKQPVSFPPPGAPPLFRMKGPPGEETIIAICTEKAEKIEGIIHDFTKPQLTRSTTRGLRLTRAIEVLAADPKAKPQERPVNAEVVGGKPVAADSARTAIKLTVR